MPETSASATQEPASQEATATATNPFDRLLVPIDFSSASRAAYTLAMRLAERWGSEVVLFHAAEADGNDEFLDHTGVPWGRSDVVGETREHLRRFADTVVPGTSSRVRVEAVRADSTVRAVVGACARYSPTMVVLGTRPRDRRRVFRSPAERIMRAVSCPVLVVQGEPEALMDADA
ncbi:MAG TPA: universal stress protein [Polyangiaceae bacterium]